MAQPRDIAGFIFDVDGCVARGNHALPGVPETLATLRARGIRCAFLTNENQRTRAQVVDKLHGMGIPAGTVKSRTHYALRSLRLALEELGVTR